MASVKVWLFGDGTLNPVDCIMELDRDSRASPTLNAFLHLTAAAMRNELSRSISPSKLVYPEMDSVAGLAEWYSNSNVPEVAISNVLLCVAQLGVLIRGCEREPATFEMSESHPIWCIGLCNGMFAAAAAATCRSSADLLALAPAMVCLSMRLMFASLERSHSMENSRDAWTIVTPSVCAEAHESFMASFLHARATLPIARRPFISCISGSVTTISGPPSSLTAYLNSNETLKNTKKVSTPINSIFHAPHLWCPSLKAVLGDDKIWDTFSMKPNIKFLSNSTGRLFDALSLRSLLVLCMGEIMSSTFRWDKVLQELCHDLRQSYSRATILSVGPDGGTAAVIGALSDAGVQATMAQFTRSNVDKTLPSADSIAITGFGTRLPGANNLEGIWELLRDGKSTHSEVSADRGALKDSSSARFGCFVNSPGFFDAKMFNMSPREASQTDPGQRLALLTTYEALERAGYAPNSSPAFSPERVATFWGQTLDDYRDTEAAQNVDIYHVTGGIRAFGPGRMNHHFKWQGPSMSVDTACSSSAVAIQLAVQSLRTGECDLAVAGGSNIITSPNMYVGLSKGGFLSKTGACKTFDDSADGYCRGEGVGTVVLKRLQDALDDHDNILAVIRSCATNHSASAESITRPEIGAQVKVFRQALRKAGVRSHEIDYVEMHGTGTSLGDRVEFSSAAEVLRCGREKRRGPVHVGSIKANVGHGEGAAGINSFVKVLLMLRNNVIPPHRIGDKVNRKFKSSDLEVLSINQDLKAFPRTDVTRKIALHSFDAAGGNTAFIIEDAPWTCKRATDPRPYHVVTVSGHTSSAFRGNQQNLIRHIRRHTPLLSDLAYTVTARRMHHSYRKSFVAQDFQHLLRLMTEASEPSIKSDRKIVFAFTGQGSHFFPAAQQLMKTCKVFRGKLQHCESICRSLGLPGFMDLMENPLKSDTEVSASQISILAIQIALVATLRTWGIFPHAVIGHSIGEYAALVTAGVLDEIDALYLAGRRAQLIEEFCEQNEFSMLSVSASADDVEGMLIDETVSGCVLACDNTPSSVVISGPTTSITRLAQKLSVHNISNTPLDLAFGFHSPQFKDIGLKLAELGREITFHEPRLPFASAHRGEVITRGGLIDSEYLASHTTGTVRYRDALHVLSKYFGPRETANAAWVEIGTHPTCGPMIRSTLDIQKSLAIYTLRRNEDSWQTLSRCLARCYELGVDIDWAAYHNEHHAFLSVIDLPTYSFDLKNYWIPYVGTLEAKNKRDDQPSAPSIDSRLAPFHYIAQEIQEEGGMRVQFACCLVDTELSRAIKGHLIEGIALCPASVYADLAFHAAARLLEETLQHTQGSRHMDLGEFTITSPLVLGGNDSGQTLLVDARCTATDPHNVYIAFSSTNQGTENKVHCSCSVTTRNDGKEEQWQEHQYLIQSRLDLLSQPKAQHINVLDKQMIYHLFAAAIADYSDQYRTITRMAIDYENSEAMAELEFPPSMPANPESSSPGHYCLDALMHMAGFLLNSDPHVSKDTVFIASGWTSLYFSEPLLPGKCYIAHTRMASDSKQPHLMIGNVTVLLENRIVGVCRGLKFNKMSRASLQRLLHSKNQAHRDGPAVGTDKQVQPRPFMSAPTMTGSNEATPTQPCTDAKDYVSEMLKILSSELNVPVQDLHANVRLSELGIDSLLSITLLNELKTAMSLELPADIFSRCNDMGALKKFFQLHITDYGTQPSPEGSRRKTQELKTWDDLFPPRGSHLKEAPASNNGGPHAAADTDSMSSILCDIIADEARVPVNNISPTMTASDLGIDSLLIISIAERYKSQTGSELNPNIFYEHLNMGMIFAALDAKSDPKENLSASSSTATEDDDSSVPTTPSEPHRDLRCISMRLQGPASSPDPALFFLPDGSGSLFSYIHIPNLNPNLAVYALDSPFHKNPQDYNVSFAAVASIYKKEILDFQPNGPYMIAGWSLGGVHAYEVARQLLHDGKEVKHLIMLDSPCPGVLPPLPHASLDLLEKAGVFQSLDKSAGEKVKEHTRAHFVAATNAFQHWDYRALTADERSRLGKVTILWAGKGVLEDDGDAASAHDWVSGMDEMDHDMMKAKEWLCGKRTRFDQGGWDKLVGKEIECRVIPGNHFSMMFPPVVADVANALRSVLSGSMG